MRAKALSAVNSSAATVVSQPFFNQLLPYPFRRDTGISSRLYRHRTRITGHEAFSSLLTNNCKITTASCLSPRPVDRLAFASHNSHSALSFTMAPITEEGE